MQQALWNILINLKSTQLYSIIDDNTDLLFEIKKDMFKEFLNTEETIIFVPLSLNMIYRLKDIKKEVVFYRQIINDERVDFTYYQREHFRYLFSKLVRGFSTIEKEKLFLLNKGDFKDEQRKFNKR